MLFYATAHSNPLKFPSVHRNNPANTSRLRRSPLHCRGKFQSTLKGFLMYQDLIRNELHEAADTLSAFLKDEANTQVTE